MKRSVVIILAVAIIGAAGVLAKNHNVSTPPQTPANAQSSSTSSQPIAASTNTSGSSSSATSYKDGTFTGQSEDTEYGTVQVAAVVSGGKITNVEFLQMPGPEGHSREITAFAEPYLKTGTLQAQSSQIDFVSGATTTSEAYIQSLQAALDQAAVS